MGNTKTRLLLIYNADSGVLNAAKDTVWKLVSPGTYPCSLCAITHRAFSMHNDWRRFLESLPIGVVFHHRDDFAQAYPDHSIALPAIAIASGSGAPRAILSNAALDQIMTTTELMEQVKQALVAEHVRAPELRILAYDAGSDLRSS